MPAVNAIPLVACSQSPLHKMDFSFVRHFLALATMATFRSHTRRHWRIPWLFAPRSSLLDLGILGDHSSISWLGQKGDGGSEGGVTATAFWQRQLCFVMCHISFSPGNCAAVTKYLLSKNCQSAALAQETRFNHLIPST